MVVCKTLGVGAGAGRVAELNLGKFLGGGDHVGLVTEGVGEDDAASGVGKLLGRFLALLRLGYIGLENVLIFAQTQLLARGLGSVHEVEVIGGVLVMQEDEADLEGIGGDGRGCGIGCGIGCGGGGGLTAGAQGKDHAQCKNKCENLLHVFSSINIFILLYGAL